MTRLNLISTEMLQEEQAELAPELDEMLATPTLAADAADTIGGLALRLGLVGHALGNPAHEVAARFRCAARHLAAALSHRPEPGPDDFRDPFRAELWLDVIAAFGTTADRQRCAALEAGALRHPAHVETATQGAYLKLLQRAVAGLTPEPAAVRAVLKACDAPTASRDDRLGVLPCARGLDAIARRDARGLNEALAQRLAAHAEDALRGDFKRRFEGLVCLPALALAAIGQYAGLVTTVTSDYLPLQLLSPSSAP